MRISVRGLTIALGAIWVGATAGPLQAGDGLAQGGQIYRQRCQACHSVTDAPVSTLGPSLRGIVGRSAASTPFAYSAALKASKLTWTRATLDRFLSGPASMVPGTRMAVSISDPGQRKALIDFLAGTK